MVASFPPTSFYRVHWYPPKKYKYGKPRLGESTSTQTLYNPFLPDKEGCLSQKLSHPFAFWGRQRRPQIAFFQGQMLWLPINIKRVKENLFEVDGEDGALHLLLPPQTPCRLQTNCFNLNLLMIWIWMLVKMLMTIAVQFS